MQTDDTTQDYKRIPPAATPRGIIIMTETITEKVLLYYYTTTTVYNYTVKSFVHLYRRHLIVAITHSL